MKTHLGLQKTMSVRFGEFLAAAGFSLFAFTFWIPQGFYLGGDASFLGGIRPELEVVFPIAGIGIFLAFFGQFLSRKQAKLSHGQVLFFLIWVAAIGVISLFSVEPKTSLLFLILWMTGILSANLGSLFWIDTAPRRVIFLLSCLIGILAAKFVSMLGVSANLVGVAATLGLYFLSTEDDFFGKWLFHIFYLWIVLETGNGFIISIALLSWLFSHHFFTTPKFRFKLWFFSLLFALGFLIWKISGQDIHFVFWSAIPHFFESLKNILVGIGDGQFLPVFQKMSDVILSPSQLQTPGSGLWVTFFEQGIFGVVLKFVFFIFARLFHAKKSTFPVVLLAIFWIFSSAVGVDENGILFLTVFLFATMKNHQEHSAIRTEKFVNQIR